MISEKTAEALQQAADNKYLTAQEVDEILELGESGDISETEIADLIQTGKNKYVGELPEDSVFGVKKEPAPFLPASARMWANFIGNLGANDPRDKVNILKKMEPNLDFAVFNGEVAVSKPNANDWYSLEPGFSGPKELLMDIAEGSPTVAKEAAKRVGQAATLSAMAGTNPMYVLANPKIASSLAYAPSSAVVDLLGQGLAKLAGGQQELDFTDIGANIALDAGLSPIFGGMISETQAKKAAKNLTVDEIMKRTTAMTGTQGRKEIAALAEIRNKGYGDRAVRSFGRAVGDIFLAGDSAARRRAIDQAKEFTTIERNPLDAAGEAVGKMVKWMRQDKSDKARALDDLMDDPAVKDLRIDLSPMLSELDSKIAALEGKVNMVPGKAMQGLSAYERDLLIQLKAMRKDFFEHDVYRKPDEATAKALQKELDTVTKQISQAEKSVIDQKTKIQNTLESRKFDLQKELDTDFPRETERELQKFDTDIAKVKASSTDPLRVKSLEAQKKEYIANRESQKKALQKQLSSMEKDLAAKSKEPTGLQGEIQKMTTRKKEIEAELAGKPDKEILSEVSLDEMRKKRNEIKRWIDFDNPDKTQAYYEVKKEAGNIYAGMNNATERKIIDSGNPNLAEKFRVANENYAQAKRWEEYTDAKLGDPRLDPVQFKQNSYREMVNADETSPLWELTQYYDDAVRTKNPTAPLQTDKMQLMQSYDNLGRLNEFAQTTASKANVIPQTQPNAPIVMRDIGSGASNAVTGDPIKGRILSNFFARFQPSPRMSVGIQKGFENTYDALTNAPFYDWMLPNKVRPYTPDPRLIRNTIRRAGIQSLSPWDAMGVPNDPQRPMP